MKIAVLTATRAEFGLLKPIILKLLKDDFFDVSVLVTGMHLSSDFGNTYKEIEDAGIEITKKINIQLSSDEPSAISKTMALALMGFGDYFDEQDFDALLVLGDRYETLAVCCAAMNARIPILHVHGGELTEGAIDDAIRHSITKMSYLHFTSTEVYRNRVIQLGEEPSRVFNVGAVGVENAINTNLLHKEELEEQLGVNLGDKYAVVTFQPVTLEKDSALNQVNEMLSAMEDYPEIFWIITKANSDANGRIINKRLEEFSLNHNNAKCFASLGMLRYLSAVKYAAFVLGNSSSGLIEVPAFNVPTINIGDRQRGRIMPESVIQSKTEKEEIKNAINIALSKQFRDKIKCMKSLYGNGDTSDKIIKHIKTIFSLGNVDIKKKFYDIEYKC